MTNVATPPTTGAPHVQVTTKRRRSAAPGSQFGPPIALVVLFVAFSIAADGFLTLGNLQTLLDQAAIGSISLTVFRRFSISKFPIPANDRRT